MKEFDLLLALARQVGVVPDARDVAQWRLGLRLLWREAARWTYT